ncbi:hypothetical protein [Saccharomonospora sp.]|uniref:hypothetical protein n=1 Tax=Saccharomonospora sp. TaxID=33913 RepID=UPI0026216E5C|nr:hypothetical protein [Saccharomonospora sp.]
MTLSSRTRPRSAVVALALGLVVGSGTTVSATEAEDSRAASHDGDVKTCDSFGGGPLVAAGGNERVTNLPDLVYEGGEPESDTHLTITDVPEGITVTAIVVKGGPRHNVYVPGERRLSSDAPWKDLHAPLNDDGDVPTIEHWFACGEESPTPESFTESDATSSAEQLVPSETGDAEEPVSDEADGLPSSSAPAESTGTNPTGGPTAQEGSSGQDAAVDDLASTGYRNGWLVGLGVALLAGGGALLALAQRRRGKAAS